MPKNDKKTPNEIYDFLEPIVNDNAKTLHRIIELSKKEHKNAKDLSALESIDDDRYEGHETRNEIRAINQEQDIIHAELKELGNISEHSATEQLKTIEKFNRAHAKIKLKEKLATPEYAEHIQSLKSERQSLLNAIAELETRMENRMIDLDNAGYSEDLHTSSERELEQMTPEYDKMQSRLTNIEMELKQLQNTL